MSLATVDIDWLSLEPGDRVLDLGCGEGRHAILAYLGGPADVVALDIEAGDLAVARSRFRDFDVHDPDRTVLFVSASGLLLPFSDGAFDAVICSEVLEHIHDFPALLREIDRVLKRCGRLAVSVPRFGPEWICWRLSRAYHQVAGGHVRIFRTRELKTAIERHDMRCYHRHWAHALHSPYWWLRCLLWDRAERSRLVRTYHRFLVWDLMSKPRITRIVERLLNPMIGKSVVLYFRRQPS